MIDGISNLKDQIKLNSKNISSLGFRNLVLAYKQISENEVQILK